jgi:hypothetical protein
MKCPLFVGFFCAWSAEKNAALPHNEGISTTVRRHARSRFLP